jgi:hypothetical protein
MRDCQLSCRTSKQEDYAEDLVRVERLTAGQPFHRTVQSAFLTGLAGAWGFKERPWRLIQGGRGRVDLAVAVDGDEQMLVIIEIKGTDWDAIAADRVLRNLRRHLHQLQAYLAVVVLGRLAEAIRRARNALVKRDAVTDSYHDLMHLRTRDPPDMHGLAESSWSYLVRADLSVLHAQSQGCPPPCCGRGGAVPVR